MYVCSQPLSRLCSCRAFPALPCPAPPLPPHLHRPAEILHGALRHISPRAFFYFRDVSYLQTLPLSERGVYMEMGVAEERIQSLKRAIVDRGYRVRFFKTPQENADMIEEGQSALLMRCVGVRSEVGTI
jgi:hypothetical protein